MWNLDLALADVVSTSSDPQLGAIRLAWWRERLEDLDRGREAPAEPRLQAVAAELLERGIEGRQLSLLEDGWLPLLGPFPWGPSQSDALKLRGSILFRTGARLLECDEEAAAAAGAVWSLVDGARHCSDGPSRTFLIDAARSALTIVPKKIPAPLRPLTILAALGAAELGGEGSAVRRLKSALVHRLAGRFPRA